MRAIVLAMCLGLCVSCSVFEPVAMQPEAVAALEARLGPLEEALARNAEDVRVAAEELTGLKVESVSIQADTKQVMVKLESVVTEVAEKAAKSAVEMATKNPSPMGIAEWALSVLCVLGVAVLGRAGLAKAGVGLKKAAAATPEVAP
jgi:hypothetical protein